ASRFAIKIFWMPSPPRSSATKSAANTRIQWPTCGCALLLSHPSRAGNYGFGGERLDEQTDRSSSRAERNHREGASQPCHEEDGRKIGGRSGQDGGRTGGEVRRAQGRIMDPTPLPSRLDKPPSLRLLVAEQQGVQCRKGTA